MNIGTASKFRNLMTALLAGLVCAGCTMLVDTRYYEPPKTLGPAIAAPGSE